jgi:hypothetical protein
VLGFILNHYDFMICADNIMQTQAVVETGVFFPCWFPVFISICYAFLVLEWCFVGFLTIIYLIIYLSRICNL